MARTDPQINIRVTTEFKKKLEITAIESGRSLNAEVVMRLEASFKPKQVELIEETAKVRDAVFDEPVNYGQLKQQYFQKQLIKLDFYLERLDLKINGYNYILSLIETGNYQGNGQPTEIAQSKFKTLLEAAQIERESIQQAIERAYDDSGVDAKFLIENEIKSILNKVG